MSEYKLCLASFRYLCILIIALLYHLGSCQITALRLQFSACLYQALALLFAQEGDTQRLTTLSISCNIIDR